MQTTQTIILKMYRNQIKMIGNPSRRIWLKTWFLSTNKNNSILLPKVNKFNQTMNVINLGKVKIKYYLIRKKWINLWSSLKTKLFKNKKAWVFKMIINLKTKIFGMIKNKNKKKPVKIVLKVFKLNKIKIQKSIPLNKLILRGQIQ